jgi:hypothetical protein
MSILDDFAAARPGDVLRRTNEWFVASDAAPDLIREANRLGVRVLGMEGFIINDRFTYPALSRIADFSNDPAEAASRKAIDLLTGEWASPPTAADQMDSEAQGRHMIAIVLEE